MIHYKYVFPLIVAISEGDLCSENHMCLIATRPMERLCKTYRPNQCTPYSSRFHILQCVQH